MVVEQAHFLSLFQHLVVLEDWKFLRTSVLLQSLEKFFDDVEKK